MPRNCTVCTHPQEAEINAALAAGERSFRDIARSFGLEKDAIHRHWKEHIPDVVVQAQHEKDIMNVIPVVDNLRDAQALTQGMVAAAIDDKTGKIISVAAASRAVHNLVKLSEIQLRVQEVAYLEQSAVGQTDIYTHPDILALMQIVREELTNYPDVVEKISARIYALRQRRSLPSVIDR